MNAYIKVFLTAFWPENGPRPERNLTSYYKTCFFGLNKKIIICQVASKNESNLNNKEVEKISFGNVIL